jgi:hypothetical protein
MLQSSDCGGGVRWRLQTLARLKHKTSNICCRARALSSLQPTGTAPSHPGKQQGCLSAMVALALQASAIATTTAQQPPTTTIN